MFSGFVWCRGALNAGVTNDSFGSLTRHTIYRSKRQKLAESCQSTQTQKRPARLLSGIRQNEPFCLLLKSRPQARRGFQRFYSHRTLDKTNDSRVTASKTTNQVTATGKTVRANLGYAQHRWISLLPIRTGTRQFLV